MRRLAARTKVASSNPAPYGDIGTAIQNVELVDIPPGMVLAEDRGQISKKGNYDGGKPSVQPKSAQIPYTEVGEADLVIPSKLSGRIRKSRRPRC